MSPLINFEKFIEVTEKIIDKTLNSKVDISYDNNMNNLLKAIGEVKKDLYNIKFIIRKQKNIFK